MNSFIKQTKEFNRTIIQRLFESPMSGNQRPPWHDLSVSVILKHNHALKSHVVTKGGKTSEDR